MSNPSAAPGRRPSALIYGCLILSGSTSLVYELLWTRVLSFSFGSTSLAFAAVLAVFFLGLAGGSLIGGVFARRLANPIRAYGWLELLIGLYAAASFPLLFRLHHLFALHNAGGAEPSGLAFRFLAAAAVLAVPTLCMGATFPILLEQLRRDRSPLAEGLGRLYGVNTLGAFLGVYAATHWLVPVWGLQVANYVAVAVNVVVFAIAFAGSARPAPAADALGAAAGTGDAEAAAIPPEERRRYAWAGLILLAASGCTTLGYEVVWGRVLTIALEGSLYGIGTTLGSFLAGIGLGGLAFSLAARRLRHPARLFHAYLFVCLAMVAYLALSRLTLPVEGYLLRAVNGSVRGILGLHLGFGIGVLFLLPITAALGFMFPAAVALYNLGRANPAEGAGKAYALNTFMSVTGSLASASFLMDRIGIEGIVFLGALIMLGSLLMAVLLAESGRPRRMAWVALVALPLLLAGGAWPAIDARTVLLGTAESQRPSLGRLFASLAAQFSPRSDLRVYKDGVGTTLTVFQNGRTIGLQSNGLPQSGRNMDPPHFNLESSLVGLLPVLHKPGAENALVVGLGTGVTAGVLRLAGVPRVEVVELEPALAGISRGIYPKGESPLDDTGVTLHIDDARNFLVRNGYREAPRAWDLIASQPAHPWVTGAADLFTEEMFRLAYRNLAEGGVFCQWFMESGVDDATYAAISNAFSRVFDGAAVYRASGGASGLYFIGTRGRPALSLDAVEGVFRRDGLRRLLDLHGVSDPAGIFQYAVTGLTDAKTLLAPGRAVNRDLNAYVESRMPLLPKGVRLAPGGLEGKSFPGPLPDGFDPAGARETLFVFEAIDRLSGNIPSVRPAEADSLRAARLASFQRRAPPPFSIYHGLHLDLALRRAGPVELAAAESEAERRGMPLLATQIRLLRLKLWPAGPGSPLPAGFEGLPADFRARFLSQAVLALAEAGRHAGVDSLAAGEEIDSAHLGMARLLAAHAAGDATRAAAFLSEDVFAAVYRKALTDWAHKRAYVAAVEAYCRAQGMADRAAVAARVLEAEAQLAVQKLLGEALRLKARKAWPEALAVLGRALEQDPTFMPAYINQAEIHGRRQDRPALSALEARLKESFPHPDIHIQRVRDAYDLVPADSLAAGIAPF